VPVDWGEWGVQLRTISDHIIEHAKWKTEADKKKTIDEIIMKHDYLRSAYMGLWKAELQPMYYSHIKKMAQRDVEFEIREEALFALAKFRKREDIPLIKEVLQGYSLQMGRSSWGLLTEFPDTSYMEVLQDYYRRRFYKVVCRDRDLEKAGSYIGTLASYRSDSSAKILKEILNRKPMVPCTTDTVTLRQQLVRSIWNNPCTAYATLRGQISAEMRGLLKRDSINEAWTAENSGQLDTTGFYRDTATEPVRW